MRALSSRRIAPVLFLVVLFLLAYGLYFAGLFTTLELSNASGACGAGRPNRALCTMLSYLVYSPVVLALIVVVELFLRRRPAKPTEPENGGPSPSTSPSVPEVTSTETDRSIESQLPMNTAALSESTAETTATTRPDSRDSPVRLGVEPILGSILIAVVPVFAQTLARWARVQTGVAGNGDSGHSSAAPVVASTAPAISRELPEAAAQGDADLGSREMPIVGSAAPAAASRAGDESATPAGKVTRRLSQVGRAASMVSYVLYAGLWLTLLVLTLSVSFGGCE